MELPRYVFLVKNLRGVLAVEPSEAGRYVDWLARRFRYRDLGVPSCLVGEAGEAFRGKLGGNPFHVLSYPTERVEHAARILASTISSAGVDQCVAEAILLASSYASPLHVTANLLAKLREAGLVVHVVKGPTMDVKSAKLHLRIVDYSVLDMYVDSVAEAVNCIERRCDPAQLVEMRRRRAIADEKRYWRLQGRGDLDVVAYLDHVHLLLERGHGLDLLVGSEERVLLAMVVAFNLDAVVEEKQQSR
jgi:hypothetical protein